LYIKTINFANITERKTEIWCLWCTVKTCKALIETNDVIVVAHCGDHDHSDKVSNVIAVRFRLLVCQKTTTTRTGLFRSGWCCYSAAALLAMQSAVIPTAIPSVRLSVRPSHTGTLSRRMNIGSRGLHYEVAKTL